MNKIPFTCGTYVEKIHEHFFAHVESLCAAIRTLVEYIREQFLREIL